MTQPLLCSQLRRLDGHTDYVRAAAVSPSNGETWASGAYDHTVRLWDVVKGEELAVLRGHANHVTAVAFSPDGIILASGSDDGTVKLWNTNTGDCVSTLSGHSDW